MKLLKENGMLDLDELDELCWKLRMLDLRIKPAIDGVWKVDPSDWTQNKKNIMLMKQTLEYIRQSTVTTDYLRKKRESLEGRLEKRENKIKQLTEEKESVEIENVNLRTKIQEAQVTAGLFIQSVKDKLPDWFSKKEKQ